ncbi:MAG TPA: large conductance mechanosensitive channel protein MscL [Acidimicrobiia bacterium]|nr:large conductance mechanosensitive channel protein MscL [Acidimicrobiia bacterium]
MKKFIQEFKEFINKGSILDLAVAFVLGVAFAAVVTSFVNDVVMAIVGAIVGKPSFNDLTLEIGNGVVFYGKFLTAVINLLIIGLVLFLIMKAFNAMKKKEDPQAEVTEKDVLIEIRDALQRQS